MVPEEVGIVPLVAEIARKRVAARVHAWIVRRDDGSRNNAATAVSYKSHQLWSMRGFVGCGTLLGEAPLGMPSRFRQSSGFINLTLLFPARQSTKSKSKDKRIAS
jgi:hypothetical protein